MVCIKTPQGTDSDDTIATTRDDTMAATRDDTMAATRGDTMATTHGDTVGAALRGRPNKAQHPPRD